MRKIIVNKAQCLLCGDILVSEHKEDSKWCSCKNLVVEGGAFITLGWLDIQGNLLSKEAFMERIGIENYQLHISAEIE